MLIAMYLVYKYVLPIIWEVTLEVVNGLGPAMIMVAGVLIMLSAFGLRMTNGLGATALGGIFHGIGWIIDRLWKVLSWMLCSIPKVYCMSRNTAYAYGLNAWPGRIVAALLVVLYVI